MTELSQPSSIFCNVEAISVIVLLAAAVVALSWANSPFAHSYHYVWNLPVPLRFGGMAFERPLHFWINDALMTVFFLVVGMEICRKIHEGALSTFDQAILPVLAAIGGVLAPALIYLSFNVAPGPDHGWAIATAPTSRSRWRSGAARKIHSSQCSGLSACACYYCDIIAVLIIRLFYTGGLI